MQAEQAGERSFGRVVSDIRDRPDQVPVCPVKCELHACVQDEHSLTGWTSRATIEDYLARLRLIGRREVVHDDSTPAARTSPAY